jgi:hypothetical protein
MIGGIIGIVIGAFAIKLGIRINGVRKSNKNIDS